ncbi:NUMOD1 domain-containing DNA-binding protein [Clostridium botulinum]|uniref:NUMOD1 domain-containing DNA-binding protein n=1 Tax=Clostridium botulinum TaxID=1491 RepID=UPI0009B26D0D|nr:hypothetical protein IG390_13810 [Clostridium botulinum]
MHAHKTGLCNNHYKKVVQYNLNGQFIKSYKTLREASLSLGKKKNDGAISMCCHHKIKTAYGFVWKFVD